MIMFYFLKHIEKMKKDCGDYLDLPDSELIELAREKNDSKAVLALFTQCIRSIVDKALKFSVKHRKFSLDDFISAGCVGFLNAIKGYKPAKKAKFSYYASLMANYSMTEIVKASMKDGLAYDKYRKYIRVISTLESLLGELCGKGSKPALKSYAGSLRDAGSLRIDEFDAIVEEIITLLESDSKGITPRLVWEYINQLKNIAEDHRSSPVIQIEDYNGFKSVDNNQIEDKDILTSGMSSLSEKEEDIMYLYYFEELTMRKIGEKVGLTESRVSQIHSKALIRMRRHLKNQ